MYVGDFVFTTGKGIEFVTYAETPRKLAKVDFATNEESLIPRCLLPVDRDAL